MRIRAASGDDFPVMLQVTHAALRALATRCYPPEQIEESIATGAWTLSRELLQQGRYFVAEENGSLLGGSGWNLIPVHAAESAIPPLPQTAFLRATYVAPFAAGRGIGTKLLRHCLADIRAAGFRHVELYASHNAEALYARHGFLALEPQALRLASGAIMPGTRMHLSFDAD